MSKDLIIQSLQKEINSLKDSMEKECRAKVAAEESLKDLQQKHCMLEFNYNNLKRMVFGSSSERSRVALDQVTKSGKVVNMFDAATEQHLKEDFFGIIAEKEAEEKALEEKYDTSSRKPKKKTVYKPTGRKEFPKNLLRKTTIIDPKGIDLNKATFFGQDKTEILNYTPATIWVEATIRNKYIIKDEQSGIKTFHQSPALKRPIDRISAGPSLLATILIDKFVYHLPIYRQIKKFEALGCLLAASTICGWLDKVQDLLMPLYKALIKEVLDTDSLQADESTIGVMGYKSGKLHTGYMWLVRNVNKRIVVFDFAMGRSAKYPIHVLKDYKGHLQVDGYVAYEVPQIGGSAEITLSYCHTHTRRYFDKCVDYDAVRAQYYIDEVGKVYAVEREIKELNLSGAQKVAYREKYAQPILEQLGEWLKKQEKQVMPGTPMRIAINYALKRWNGLMIYLHHANLEIDTNLIENNVRGLALGRRNWLFAGSGRGAQRNALMYSLVACCQENNIDPYQYLVDIITRIGDHKISEVKDLLPHNWKPLSQVTSSFNSVMDTAEAV